MMTKRREKILAELKKCSGRFWGKVAPAWNHTVTVSSTDPVDLCWEWQGSRKKVSKARRAGGATLPYGQFWFMGRCWAAHIISFAKYTCRPPQELGLIAHQCDNPFCVRPSHLKETVPTVNLKEAYARGRRPRVQPKKPTNKEILNTAEDLLRSVDIKEMHFFRRDVEAYSGSASTVEPTLYRSYLRLGGKP